MSRVRQNFERRKARNNFNEYKLCPEFTNRNRERIWGIYGKRGNRMKLWIRNMWKNGLYEVNGVVAMESGDKWQITDCRSVLPLGEYATRERCLEIIDEIQKLLYCDFVTVNSNTTIKDLDRIINERGSILHFPKEHSVEYHSASTVVYEMPEE